MKLILGNVNHFGTCHQCEIVEDSIFITNKAIRRAVYCRFLAYFDY